MTQTKAPQAASRHAPGEPGSSFWVILAVARFEGKRVWRHPALLVAVAATAYELYQRVEWSRAPVLNRDSYTSAWPMMLLAAGVYLAIGSAANRRHGVQDDDALRGVPVSPVTQTLGTGLAFFSPLLVAVLMQGTVLALRSLNDPVTSLTWTEVLVGPVTVALGAAAGLAIGWGFRSPMFLPLAGVGFAGAILIVWWWDSGFLFGPYTPYFAPVPMLDINQSTLEQAYRPSTEHLLYLVLLTAFFAVVATLRGQQLRGRVLASGLALALLVGTVWAGTSQLHELSPAEEAVRRGPYDPVTGNYVCEERDAVTYCAYPGYERWIEEWAAEVEPVLALVPEEVSGRSLEIRQQVPYFQDGDQLPLPGAGDVIAGMWWSRRAYDSSLVPHRLGMALAAATWAVGFPTEALPVETSAEPVELADPASTDPDEIQYRACHSNGQGRAVAALWYSIQSSPESLDALQFLSSGERYGGVAPEENFTIGIGYRQPGSSVTYYRREASIALQLSDLPIEDVAGTFADRWEELTDPATSTEDVAGWFGLAVPRMGPADDTWTVPCP